MINNTGHQWKGSGDEKFLLQCLDAFCDYEAADSAAVDSKLFGFVLRVLRTLVLCWWPPWSQAAFLCADNRCFYVTS